MDKADLSDGFTFLRLRYHSRRTSAFFQSGAVLILGGRPPKMRTDPITVQAGEAWPLTRTYVQIRKGPLAGSKGHY